MNKVEFELVDQGCLMYENKGGRWIIEKPLDGYLPTISNLWDVIIEHPENPHKEPLKYLGSFGSKKQAIKFVNQKIRFSENYFSIEACQNQFYNKDYSQK